LTLPLGDLSALVKKQAFSTNIEKENFTRNPHRKEKGKKPLQRNKMLTEKKNEKTQSQRNKMLTGKKKEKLNPNATKCSQKRKT
jgi:hypothetical protein